MDEVWTYLVSVCKDHELSRTGHLFWNKVPEAKVISWKPSMTPYFFHLRVQVLQCSFPVFLSHALPSCPATSHPLLLSLLCANHPDLLRGSIRMGFACFLPLQHDSLTWVPLQTNASFRPQLLWRSPGKPSSVLWGWIGFPLHVTMLFPT